MQNSEFEKSVQRQMDELKISPSPGLWDKIEPKLPAPGRHRRWLAFLLLLAFLTAGSIYTWRHFGADKNANSNNFSKATRAMHGGGQGAKQKNKLDSRGMNTNLKASTNPKSATENDHGLVPKDNGVPTKPGAMVSVPEENNNESSGYRRKSRQETHPSKTIVKTFSPTTENGDKAVTGLETTTLVSSDPPVGADTTSLATSIPDTLTASNPPSTVKIVTDTTGHVPGRKPDVTPRSNHSWKYGLHLGAGLSTVKNSLFGKSPIFADTQGSLSTGSSGNMPAAAPQNPKPAISFEGGFYLKKQLSKRWSLTTGLNYAYLSNTIHTGMRVDTNAIVTFSTRSLAAGNYFRTGTGTRYRNKFHILDMPLLFSYNFPGKFPLSAEFGSTISYLLKSNAIVYNRSIGGYITDVDVFNKMLLSLDAGAAINLKQWTGYPVNLGYRFRYSLGSATKKAFGGQHLLNSTFYLDIPIKK
jgi:hypothetical protein